MNAAYFFSAPYDFLFAHKTTVFSSLLTLTFLGLAVDLWKGIPRKLGETISNIVIFAGNNSVNLLIAQTIQLAALGWLERFSPFALPVNAVTLALCLIGVDFCYYWRHRWEHEIALLWAEHSVHHSSEEYNFSTSLRLPWITPLFGWVFFAPMVLLGFPAKLVLASFFLDLLYQYWVHNDSIGRLGILENYLSTPSNHRVHHARNPEYLDKNYGGIFIVWDRLFRTYEPEKRRPDYGIVHPIGTQNPILINLRPFARLYRKMAQQPNFTEKVRIVLGPPV